MSNKLLDVFDKNGNRVDLNKFDMVGLYFSANWCPPCQEFTPELVQAYNKWKNKGEKIEIVFISNDGNEQASNEYYKKMNFLRLKYDEEIIKDLNSRCGVDGIPHLEIRTSDLKQTITKYARDEMSNRKAAVILDWKNTLSELPSGKDLPSFFSDEFLATISDGEGTMAVDSNLDCGHDIIDPNDCVTYQRELGDLEEHASDVSHNSINILFENAIKGKSVMIDWINFDGERENWFTISTHEEVKQQTYTGHRWLFLKENGEPFAIYNPHDSIKANSRVHVIINSYTKVIIEID